MWRNKKKESAPTGMSMRMRLILAFAVFAVAAIGLLWLFQTVLMDKMYELVKHQELSRCAAILEDVVGESPDDTARIEEKASDLTQEYNVCISVYEITQGYGYPRTEQHGSMLCVIHNQSNSSLLNRLYKAAYKAGGSYTEEMSMASLFQFSTPSLPDTSAGEPETAVPNDRTRSVIQIELLQTADSRTFMVLLNTEIVPLVSTVSTLKLQMVFLSVLLALLAVIMAVFVSARFSRPLTEMSKEAIKLSMGNYSVNFDGGNCRETEQLSAALNRAAYELSQLDKMQKDLIANISHDLRTPLTMIAGYSEVIRDLPGEATPENMQVIIDETHRLTSLVNDMLEVSRYQSGTQVLHTERFNFTESLRQTLSRYARLREREGYTIRLEADRDVWVEADETRILQVLYNLVGNAVNYTGEDKTVVVRQDIQGDEVILSVIDTGAGIPNDQLPLVWERYYKVHDFHKRANMGTGLGLSIVKNILVLHNARFGVRSTLGQGSVFWFALKLADAPESPDSTAGA